jgi:mono/diheme cytochrome c family protein
MHRSFRSTLVVATLLLSTAAIGMPQGQQPKTTIEQAPIKPTPANSGAEMYKNYCAPCHGANGKGDGPAARALKTAPSDLTILAKANNGQFPAMHVAEVLRGGPNLPAHGSPEMPVWGPLFSAVSSSRGIVDLRVTNLTKYLESLQVK